MYFRFCGRHLPLPVTSDSIYSINDTSSELNNDNRGSIRPKSMGYSAGMASAECEPKNNGGLGGQRPQWGPGVKLHPLKLTTF